MKIFFGVFFKIALTFSPGNNVLGQDDRLMVFFAGFGCFSDVFGVPGGDRTMPYIFTI